MKIYKYGDLVQFTIGGETFDGKVQTKYVAMADCYTNDIVFKKLNMTAEQVYKFCSDEYGYKATNGIWPTCKIADYKALSRLINALFDLCDKYNNTYDEIVKQGDFVKCIKHTNSWSKRFQIGKAYKVMDISSQSYLIPYMESITLWVQKEDFAPYKEEIESIINKQTNHVKNNSNSIELPKPFATIAAGQAPRGVAICSPNIEICI